MYRMRKGRVDRVNKEEFESEFEACCMGCDSTNLKPDGSNNNGPIVKCEDCGNRQYE